MMPGNGNTNLTNSYVVQLFHHTLWSQVGWILGVALVVAGIIVLVRQVRESPADSEPRSRTLLRCSFGVLWIIDGVLQLQPSMPLGLGNDVVLPSADGTPFWLHRLMIDGVNLWNAHPIALAAAAAWIQLGIGLFLIVTRGTLSRVAGAVAVGWGLVVWVVGNGMGGIFSPDASFLFGWPGAVMFYVIAGAWLAAPLRVFPQKFATITLRAIAVILGGGIILQLLPSHEFWHGGSSNALTAMSHEMTQAAQPHWFASVVNAGGSLASTMGGGFNIVIIIWMAVTAFGLWRSSFSGSTSNWGVLSCVVGCVVWWVIAQDGALFGGLSTDVNSMIPVAALVTCASPRIRNADPITMPLPAVARRTYASVFGAIAVAFLVVALIPMLNASVSSGAETTLYVAQNGQVAFYPPGSTAFPFTLTDQHGHAFHFPNTTKKYTLLTWLDPKCWTDCPLLAAQLKDLDQQFTPEQRAKVQFIAVAANPYHESLRDINAFMTSHQLHSMNNFYFVTGTRNQLAQNYTDYGIEVSMKRSDKMSVHSDAVYLIDPHGSIRAYIPDDPPDGTSGTSSAVTALWETIQRVGLK